MTAKVYEAYKLQAFVYLCWSLDNMVWLLVTVSIERGRAHISVIWTSVLQKKKSQEDRVNERKW